MIESLTAAQRAQFDAEGYVKLGRLLDEEGLSALQGRIDAIMLGDAALDYDRVLMQLDSSSGAYGDAGEQSAGHKGRTLAYRKIQNLELDPLFLAYTQRAIFRAACAHTYGANTPIAAFRAMFMNKPAHQGTFLPWHQDRWGMLDRDPIMTVWTALDPATVENGCVQIIPGSHKLGLVNPDHPSGFLTEAQAAEHCPAERIVHLELAAGEVALLHNWVLHASDINRSAQSRRAYSTCYMDANTVHEHGAEFSVIFGENALTPEAVCCHPSA